MFYAVITAGGSGTRLWPISRAARPKFLHVLSGGSASLLQETYARVQSLAQPRSTFVVTGTAHAAEVAGQLPALPIDNILVEPQPRDSFAAIGLAAAIIATADPEAVMGSFAADHLIRGVDIFRDTVLGAVRGAQAGWLMTIGMAPTRPETGFGYVHCGDLVGTGPVRRVLRFKEKPTLSLATEFLQSGDYLWNAGMFIWRVDVFLAEVLKHDPVMHRGLSEIAAAWQTEERDVVLRRVWPQLPKVAIDYALMEPAAAEGRVATVPGNFGWTDVGDFGNLADLNEGDASENVVVGQDTVGEKPGVMLYDAHRVIAVPRSDRLLCVLGLDDVVVVDTSDAVLVCHRDRVQDVKKLVEALRERGMTGLL